MGLQVVVKDADRSCFRGKAEPFFLDAERVFCLFAVCDILQDIDRANCAS
jgi:hypothetical protein